MATKRIHFLILSPSQRLLFTFFLARCKRRMFQFAACRIHTPPRPVAQRSGTSERTCLIQLHLSLRKPSDLLDGGCKHLRSTEEGLKVWGCYCFDVPTSLSWRRTVKTRASKFSTSLLMKYGAKSQCAAKKWTVNPSHRANTVYSISFLLVPCLFFVF